MAIATQQSGSADGSWARKPNETPFQSWQRLNNMSNVAIARNGLLPGGQNINALNTANMGDKMKNLPKATTGGENVAQMVGGLPTGAAIANSVGNSTVPTTGGASSMYDSNWYNAMMMQQSSADKAMNFEASQAALNRNWQSNESRILREYNTASAREAMDWSANEAKVNRDWQENMSNTSYQRSIKDMKAAGLNPILAALNGGAVTGTGGQGQSGQASQGTTGGGGQGRGHMQSGFPNMDTGSSLMSAAAAMLSSQGAYKTGSANMLNANSNKISSTAALLNALASLEMARKQMSYDGSSGPWNAFYKNLGEILPW